MTVTFSKKRLGSSAVLLALCLWSLSAGASAQSVFPGQNENSSLQPQSSTNQQAANTQNQASGVQQNSGGTVLDQANQQPLGVVSSPSQTTPDAVVQPSNSLRAERAQLSGRSIWPIVAAIGLVGAVTGIYFLRRKPVEANGTKSEQTIVEPVAITKPKPVKPKKNKKPHGNTRKKKRKA